MWKRERKNKQKEEEYITKIYIFKIIKEKTKKKTKQNIVMHGA